MYQKVVCRTINTDELSSTIRLKIIFLLDILKGTIINKVSKLEA